MKMKIALSLISVPLGLSFIAGVFNWFIEDGMYILMGFSMIAGAIWAWLIEMYRG